MSNTKVTRKSATAIILQFAIEQGFDNEEVIDVMNKILASYDRPTRKVESKAHKMNMNYVTKIYEKALAYGEFFDGNWVRDTLCDPNVRTPQKVTAIMRLGVQEGLFEKVAEKKKVLYKAI